MLQRGQSVQVFPHWKSREIYILLRVKFQRAQGSWTSQAKLVPTEEHRNAGSTVDHPKQVLRNTISMTHKLIFWPKLNGYLSALAKLTFN